MLPRAPHFKSCFFAHLHIFPKNITCTRWIECSFTLLNNLPWLSLSFNDLKVENNFSSNKVRLLLLEIDEERERQWCYSHERQIHFDSIEICLTPKIRKSHFRFLWKCSANLKKCTLILLVWTLYEIFSRRNRWPNFYEQSLSSKIRKYYPDGQNEK